MTKTITGLVKSSHANLQKNKTFVKLESKDSLIFELGGMHRINKGELVKLHYDEFIVSNKKQTTESVINVVRDYKILNPNNSKEVLFSTNVYLF